MRLLCLALVALVGCEAGGGGAALEPLPDCCGETCSDPGVVERVSSQISVCSDQWDARSCSILAGKVAGAPCAPEGACQVGDVVRAWGCSTDADCSVRMIWAGYTQTQIDHSVEHGLHCVTVPTP